MKRDDLPVAELLALEVLTRQRIVRVTGFSESKIQRSPLEPIGRCGRDVVYRTADVLAWMRGELGSSSRTVTTPASTRKAKPRPTTRASVSAGDAVATALAQLRVIKGGRR